MTTVTTPPAERDRASLRKTARDMALSMAVIIVLVVGVLFLIARPNQIARPEVDVAEAARNAAGGADFPLATPAGLPPGWASTSARLQRGTDGVLTWRVSYVTPDGRYAGFQQAGDPTPAWEARQVTDGREQGQVQIAGQTWVVRSRTDRGITSWVLRRSQGTIVVTGTAGEPELRALAQSLIG